LLELKDSFNLISIDTIDQFIEFKSQKNKKLMLYINKYQIILNISRCKVKFWHEKKKIMKNEK
jgi:hypothetical protein